MVSFCQKKSVSLVLSLVLVLAVVANVLFFSAQGPAPSVFGFQTNAAALGQNRLTPYSSVETNEWGAANCGTKPTGEWAVADEKNLSQNYLGGGWAVIYRKTPNAPNFKAVTNITLSQAGQSSDYPKYGVYGAYRDESNYILGMLDLKFNAFATFAKVDGKDMPWKSAPLPPEVDLSGTLELKSIKIGATVKFYINGCLVETLQYDVGDAQPGLITEDCVAQYRDYTVDTGVTEFDTAKEFPRLDSVYGQAECGTFPNGNWVFENGLVRQKDFSEGWCSTFYGSELKNSYRFSADVRLDEQNAQAEYPKYGIYAYYRNSDNYVVSMIDPKYNVLSTFARIDGKDQEWQGSALPAMDYGAFHTLSAVKNGNTIDFFVDGFLQQTRTFSLSAGQPGLIVEQCKASYKNGTLSPNADSAAWGASYDGTVPVIGQWKVTSGGGARQSALGEQMTALFYGKSALSNYKVTIPVKALKAGSTDYPKYGVYAGHHSADSFVWVFLHPKEGIISSYAKSGGKDLGWNFSNLPPDFDYSVSHELKVIKIGSEFRFYVDGAMLLTRTAGIGAAQFGLVTSDCAAEYGKPAIAAAASFDKTVEQEATFGNSFDNRVRASGDWVVRNEHSLSIGSIADDDRAHTDQIYYRGGGMLENYRFSATLKNNGMNAYPFAKFGFVAAYESDNSYIWTFLHPKEKMLSVFAMENGVVTQSWETFALPYGFDYAAEHELKVIKLNGRMKIYVDDTVAADFATGIKKAQVGFLSEGVLASYENIAFAKTDSFDESKTEPESSWGSSGDDKLSAVGDWIFDDTSARQTSLAEEVQRLFYRGGAALADYRVTAKLTPVELGQSPYSKFGFYAAYENPQNYAWVFVHPKEKFLSVYALVDGAPAVNWQIFALPQDFDYAASHVLAVEKRGFAFTILVDGAETGRFNANLGASQTGVITDSVQARYAEYRMEPLA